MRQVGHSSKFCLVLLRYKPEMEVGRSLHQRQVVDALDSSGRLDRRNKPMEKGTELNTFGWRNFTEIQQMPPSFDDDCPCAGRFQRGVLDEKRLTFDDVASWAGASRSSDPVFRPSWCRQMLQSDR